MKTSIFNQLFKIKYGNRAENFDAENHIPDWDENFEKLLADLTTRKQLLSLAASFYGHSQLGIIEVEKFCWNSNPKFKEISQLRFIEPIESIVAQQVLMLVYGIKTCTNLLSKVKTEKDAKGFYELYTILWETIDGMNKTLDKEKFDFWYGYRFKIGLHCLKLSLKTKSIGEKFFEIDKGYGLHLKGFYSSDDIHNQNKERNFKAGYHHFNPLYLITMSVTKSEIENAFIFEKLEKEVVAIIESEIEKEKAK